MRIVLIVMFLSGCASLEKDYTERVFAPQVVTGWKDAAGKIHLKGVGGEIGYAEVTGK